MKYVERREVGNDAKEDVGRKLGKGERFESFTSIFTMQAEFGERVGRFEVEKEGVENRSMDI